MSEVKLHVESLDSFFRDAQSMAAALDSGERLERENHISFETMDFLLRVLTPARWQLLRRLRRLGPCSVEFLAQELGRDYQAAHGDVVLLRDTGLLNKDDYGRIYVPWARITADIALDDRHACII